MKKYIKIIAILIVILIQSCKNDPLDIMPDGRLTLEEVFSDELMASEYVNTIYMNINPYGTGYNYYTMLAGFSDEAHDNDFPSDMGRAPSRWYNGELRPNWNPLDIQFSTGTSDATSNGNYYRKNWAGIRQCNVFLQNIVETPFNNLQTKARIIAEVKVLRAFFYLELIKMFGEMPVVDKEFTSDYKFEDLERNSFNECVAFIKQNCDEAIAEQALPMRITTEPERGRFSKAVAHAIRSQALLFGASPLHNKTGDLDLWKSAAEASKASLEVLGASNYELFDDYETYFIGRTDLSANPADKETIFEIKTYQAHEFSHLMFRMHAIPSIGGDKAGVSPSQELVDAYDMANGIPAISGYYDEDHLFPIINVLSGYDEANPYRNRDPRFYATVWYNNAYYGEINGKPHYIQTYLGGADGISSIMQRTGNGYYLRKFRDPKQLDPNTGTSRFKKYRLAELFLNYAEAANEAEGPSIEVYNAVNAIRNRAKMPDLPQGLSKEEMRNRIHRERQVELAFEEHRFWDVRRWKVLESTDKLTTGIEWSKSGDNYVGKRIVTGRRKSYTENHLILPIPFGELTLMKKWYQNPGW
ncbi:RagB/SusD family nutrient uptake outer membrane protein [Sphingobacterium sp. HJSM2_6]|uniref:RagB/SusD family nutrient uptake outer membrane protein n=1 Tax=Sphingobacterium sp. HJSM2_6 TaxID=3366264 RepID=UPI003BCC52A8